MKPDELLFLALEPDADHIAAALVEVLREELGVAEAGYSEACQPLFASLAPRIYGVGGPELEKIGLTQLRDEKGLSLWPQSSDPKGVNVRSMNATIYQTALQRQPDAIVCVGSSPVYQRLAAGVKSYVQRRQGPFFNWDPAFIHVGPHESHKSSHSDFDCDLDPTGTDERTFLRATAQAVLQTLKERRSGCLTHS